MVVNRHPEPIIKVFVVDDLRVVREKLKSVLRSHQDIEVIGVAIDGYDAIEQLEYLQPDIILLDLDMPKLDGIETAKIIDKKYSQIKVIVLSSYDDARELSSSQPNCIKEYIIKDHIVLTIVEKIRSVYNTTELAQSDNVVDFSRFAQGDSPKTSRFNADLATNLGTNLSTQFTLIANTTLTKLNDWSDSAKELIDMMPLPWTRGLLY